MDEVVERQMLCAFDTKVLHFFVVEFLPFTVVERDMVEARVGIILGCLTNVGFMIWLYYLYSRPHWVTLLLLGPVGPVLVGTRGTGFLLF